MKVEMELAEKMNRVIKGKEEKIEEAANLILERLSPHIKDFIIEIGDIMLKIPRWQVIAGTLIRAYESGVLVSPTLDPAWLEREPVKAEGKCKECGKTFELQRLGQEFCSNRCGSRWRNR